jgi:hypothetical protein
VPALAGAVAFWLANLVISLTPVAADYRSALSIAYAPMLAEAAVGGLFVASGVALLLTRFADRVPGGGPVRRSLALAAMALVLLTVVLEVPSKLLTDVADRGHWLLLATVFNVIRVLALGLSIGLVTRARTTGRGHHAGVTRREGSS